MLVNPMKAYVAKVEGVKNPWYGSKVLNFFLALAASASGDKTAFEYVSGNLCAVSLRWIKKLIADQREHAFINLCQQQMVDLIDDCISKIRVGCGDSPMRVAFTVGVDDTCLVPAW